MSLVLHPELPPIREDQDGAMRIGESRVLLEMVVHAYQGGARPEKILDMYQTLTLADVYSVIGYYLRHRDLVDAYLDERERQADVIRARIEAQQGDLKGLRERMLKAKRNQQEDASPGAEGRGPTTAPD